MGKGSRNRSIRVTDTSVTSGSEVKLSKKQLIKEQEKKAKIKKYIIMICSIVLVVGLVVGIVVATLNKAPKLEKTVSATSSKYELNNAMVAFYLYGQYQTFSKQNASYLSAFGLDTTKSLKSQTFPYGDQTWFAYFLDLAKSQINELVALASEAQEKGYALTDEDKADIDAYMVQIKAYATQAGYSTVDGYFGAAYVNGVTESAVRKCLELSQLASKYYNDYLDSLEYTDEQLEKYVTDTPAEYKKYDYIYYTFNSGASSTATDAEKKTAMDAAKVKADEFLANATDLEKFKAAINEIERTAAEEKAAADTGDSTVDPDKDYTGTYTKTENLYTEDDELSTWAVADERKEGDTTVIGDTDSYTVYILTKTVYKDEYTTKSARHILLKGDVYGTKEKAKAKAEEILKQYKDGKMVAAAFAKLAEEYSEDAGSNTNGGLYEDVAKGYMIAEFDEWIYDESRKDGDVEIIETELGYHVMFFEGDGRVVWKITAESSLKSKDYSDKKEALEKMYPVVYDATKINLIP